MRSPADNDEFMLLGELEHSAQLIFGLHTLQLTFNSIDTAGKKGSCIEPP